MKVKTLIIFSLVVMMAGASAFAEGQAEKYPVRDITDVVVWGAGGGTDTCNRVVAAEMAKVLGVNINVINKPGGVAGSVGMNYVYSQPHNGYTICGLSESCVTAGVQGGWDKRMNVWSFFIIAGSPDVVSVTPNTPYQTMGDLIEAAKDNPGSIKACASGAGSIHHLNLLALEKGAGVEFNFIPYPGSAPCQTAAMTGEVNVVITSIAEQQQLLRGGKLRALAVLVPEPFTIEGVGEVPSALQLYPELKEHLPISQAIGMAVPADTPEERKKVLEDAFKKALKTEAVKKWAKDNYYKINGKTGEAAKEEFNKLESLFGWTLWELGAAKVNPQKLGIPKP